MVGPAGSRYRLVGAGFDHVDYDSSDVTGAIQTEDEVFDFAVVGPHGLTGVVRFQLHTGPDQMPHVHDTSTCQLPNMS